MESSSECVHSMVDTKEISCLQHGTFGQDPNGMEEKSFSQVHKGTAELASVVWFSRTAMLVTCIALTMMCTFGFHSRQE